MSEEVEDRVLDWAVKISARAQSRAYKEQDVEFAQLVREKAKDLRCIGCGKPLPFYPINESDPSNGYFCDGGLLTDRMGYGSTLDMSRVAVLACDDCIKAKGITTDWMDKLHKHFENESQEA